ncbi:hypothetical protein [Paenibacillus macquariensis]|uniref:hypothetical protein n=1 Tax=Paenibacillus macquariensis TaxID=948756 RepID=UPI0014830A1C
MKHKSAELKRFHGMATARYRGLFRILKQAYITAFVVIVKRVEKLNEQKQG